MLGKIKTWLWENRIDVAIAIILFVVAAVPRMTDLGTFLTADEKNWMGRSYEFIRAIKDWRFNDTLQTTHPGVTTMWLSGISITAWMYLTHTPFSFQNLAHFAAAAQFPIAFVNSLAIPIIYLFLVKLFKEEPRFATPEEQAAASTSGVFLTGRFVPLLAAVFMALNPLLIGYSRVVHVDALLASLMLLAALATMIYAKESYKQSWLVASAVLSGLAILTKFPALFLVPFWWLVVARKRGRDFVLWSLIIILMFLVLWPALLFVPDPKGNALLVKRDLVIAAETPHHMVEDYTLNSYHYPLTLLTRMSPVTLIFASIAILWLVQSTVFKAQSPNKAQFSKHKAQTALLFFAYVFFFVVMMTLVAKKGDRYILPVFLALDVLAAFGIWVWRKRLQYILGFLSVVYLVATAWSYHPYAIAYSSPLFRDNLSQELGWGEGLEQVAAWLNEHDPEAVVAAWYPEELGAYTLAHVAHINAHEQSKIKYVVLYRNMFGRAPDHYANDFIDEYYKKREPVFMAHVAGKEFAWVYEKWVFDRIVGELLPGKKFRQEIEVRYGNLFGLDVMIATYSGRAKSGELIISIPGIHEWRVPVSEIQDDRWLTLKLPETLSLENQTITVEISVDGTKPNDAPTIRSNKDRLAVRLRYALGNGQEATEEDTRLLQSAQ